MISVILVDDEKPSLDELEYIISKFNYVEIIGKYSDSTEALEKIKIEEPDLVFLDINMPVLSGLDIADKINKLNLKTAIIFSTAYDQHALSAFEKNAIDYILKPYDSDRVLQAMRKFKKGIENENKKTSISEKSLNIIRKIPIWKGDKIVFINTEDILFCKVDEGELLMYTIKDTYKINESLCSLEEKLPRNSFLRTHRSYIVNVSIIEEVTPYFNHTLMIKVSGTKELIPVSRSNVKAFKSFLEIT